MDSGHYRRILEPLVGQLVMVKLRAQSEEWLLRVECGMSSRGRHGFTHVDRETLKGSEPCF